MKWSAQSVLTVAQLHPAVLVEPDVGVDEVRVEAGVDRRHGPLPFEVADDILAGGAQSGGRAGASVVAIRRRRGGGCKTGSGGDRVRIHSITRWAPIIASSYYQPSTVSAGKVIIGRLRVS